MILRIGTTRLLRHRPRRNPGLRENVWPGAQLQKTQRIFNDLHNPHLLPVLCLSKIQPLMQALALALAPPMTNPNHLHPNPWSLRSGLVQLGLCERLCPLPYRISQRKVEDVAFLFGRERRSFPSTTAPTPRTDGHTCAPWRDAESVFIAGNTSSAIFVPFTHTKNVRPPNSHFVFIHFVSF